MLPSEAERRPDLVDHLRVKVASLEAQIAEYDAQWRRMAAALGMEGDPMGARIVARAEDVRREMERRRARIEHLRDVLGDISRWRADCHAHDRDMGHEPRDFDGDELEAIERFATEALAKDLDRKAGA